MRGSSRSLSVTQQLDTSMLQVPMCIATLDMKVVDMNERFASLIGTHRGASNLTCLELSPVQDFHKLYALMQRSDARMRVTAVPLRQHRLMSGQDRYGECTKALKTVDGRVIQVHTTLMLVYENGEPKYILARVMPAHGASVFIPLCCCASSRAYSLATLPSCSDAGAEPNSRPCRYR